MTDDQIIEGLRRRVSYQKCMLADAEHDLAVALKERIHKNIHNVITVTEGVKS